MFAPYCPTCRCRRLLGPRRIVATAWEQGGGIDVRCYCGTIVDAVAEAPVNTARTSQSRTGTVHNQPYVRTMPADNETRDEEQIVNVISIELAHQLAADQQERLRRTRFRRPFERPAVVRPAAPRGELA